MAGAWMMPKIVTILGIVLVLAVATGAFVFLQEDAEEQTAERPEWEGRQGPAQPVAFLHSVHAGDNQIPCMYCHYTADKSASAGIPSVKLCIGCHVAGGANQPPDQVQQLTFPVAGAGGPERPEWWYAEANELLRYWQRQEPIPWVRIHDIPEHAHFPHESHVRVGLECQTCHGPVEAMEQVYQFSSLQMGWCIDCHTGETPLSDAEQASVQARSKYMAQLRTLAAAGSDVRGVSARWPDQRASVDCTVCHY